MAIDLHEKVAVITGGSRGIGKAVAIALVGRGSKVVIGDILEKEGQQTIDELNSIAGRTVSAFIRADVTKYKDIVALFRLAEKRFGGVDIAFLNAGVGKNSDVIFEPLDDDADESILRTNAATVIKGTKVAILHMAKRGGGVIVNTASLYGVYSIEIYNCKSSVGAYAASKHAVIGWTKSFTHLPEICNVRINAVCPHYVDTDLLGWISPESMKINPHAALIAGYPRAEMKTVVKAVLMLIQDGTRHTEFLFALPNDVIRPYVLPDAPMEGMSTAEVQEAVNIYEAVYPQFGKDKLAEAFKHYEEQYGAL